MCASDSFPPSFHARLNVPRLRSATILLHEVFTDRYDREPTSSLARCTAAAKCVVNAMFVLYQSNYDMGGCDPCVLLSLLLRASACRRACSRATTDIRFAASSVSPGPSPAAPSFVTTRRAERGASSRRPRRRARSPRAASASTRSAPKRAEAWASLVRLFFSFLAPVCSVRASNEQLKGRGLTHLLPQPRLLPLSGDTSITRTRFSPSTARCVFIADIGVV